MGLMQEGLRRTLGTGEVRKALHPVNLNPSEIQVSKLPARDRLESRATELLNLILGEKDKAEHAEEPKLKRQDGFEPFISGGENDENNLFVNLYGGDFSQKMELNRKGIERVLKIVHLDGKVFLTSLSPNRSRAEAHGNELAAKKLLIFGEKSKEAEENNPLARVVSVPEGWRIEINNTRITEELTEKKIGGKELQRAFINRFNSQLKGALKECIWREKFSSEKDEYFKSKAFRSLLPILFQAVFVYPFFRSNPFVDILSVSCGTILYYVGINFIGESRKGEMRNIENISKELNPTFNLRKFSLYRHIDSLFEDFMPQVEIDKVARAWTFLSLKGRRLVREAKPDTK